MTKYIKTGTTEFEQFDSHKWDLGLKEATHEYPVRGQYFRQKYEKARRKYCRKTGVYNDTTRGIYCLNKNKKAIESGDWIATGVNGEHWPVKNEIFQKTYKKLPVIPECVASYIENCKSSKVSISEALASEFRPEKMQTWLGLDEEKMKFIQEQYNQRNELVARAWLDGYEVAEVEE